MVIDIKEICKITKKKERVFIIFLMVENTKDLGKMINIMVMDFSFGLVVIDIKDNG